MKASLPTKPMYCSREYLNTSRLFNSMRNLHLIGYYILFCYLLIYNKLLPSLSRFTTELHSHILGRQFIRIYHQSLEAIGQAVTDAAFFILYFDSAVTIAHLVLISLLGCVYYSCSQHLHRTGSSYQYTKTDPDLLIKISVILGCSSDNTCYISLLSYDITKA